jgi:hypothetical protein
LNHYATAENNDVFVLLFPELANSFRYITFDECGITPFERLLKRCRSDVFLDVIKESCKWIGIKPSSLANEM